MITYDAETQPELEVELEVVPGPTPTPTPPPAKRTRAPKTPKAANPLADAKTEIKLLTAKIEMLDEQLKRAFVRKRQDEERLERLAVENQTQANKLALIERQLRNVVDTIRI